MTDEQLLRYSRHILLDALERFFRGETVKTRVTPRMLERMT